MFFAPNLSLASMVCDCGALGHERVPLFSQSPTPNQFSVLFALIVSMLSNQIFPNVGFCTVYLSLPLLVCSSLKVSLLAFSVEEEARHSKLDGQRSLLCRVFDSTAH